MVHPSAVNIGCSKIDPVRFDRPNYPQDYFQVMTCGLCYYPPHTAVVV